MQSLLYLVHRIPYPPNKGDKIRSFHFLKYLSKRYRVFLGAFVDDPEDWQYSRHLEPYCADINLVQLDPKLAKLRSFKGFLSGEALSIPYYRNAKMQRWVDRLLQEQVPELALAFSSSMAQYLNGEAHIGMLKVLDFVDIDSDKWRQYAAQKKWPLSWLFRRESIRLAEAESEYARSFDFSTFVSAVEAQDFVRTSAVDRSKVYAINNGVDLEYFSPLSKLVSPYPRNDKVLVFTGAMDYWPNVDAVVWFAHEVFPLVRKLVADARFVIVGGKPTKEVRQLAALDGVSVTGQVEDVRPYLRYATLAVAPLRIARGIQNKVLEAMAMARPVLCTSQAAAGITNFPLRNALVADEPEQLAKRAYTLLAPNTTEDIGELCRTFVSENYSWEGALEKLEQLFISQEPELLPAINA